MFESDPSSGPKCQLQLGFPKRPYLSTATLLTRGWQSVVGSWQAGVWASPPNADWRRSTIRLDTKRFSLMGWAGDCIKIGACLGLAVERGIARKGFAGFSDHKQSVVFLWLLRIRKTSERKEVQKGSNLRTCTVRLTE